METSVNHSMCRCCASEGAFKDVKSTYHWMGEEEIYADMLRECFDINLNTSEDCDESGICEVCITQLRNAINFKKQVLHTEEHYKKLVQNKALFRTNIVKIEANADDDSEGNVSADDAFSGAEFDVPIKTEEEEQKPKKRAATTKTMTTRSKKAKTESGETSTKRKVSNAKATVEKRVSNSQTSAKKGIPELYKHRSNIRLILQCSNATPIRCRGGIGYACSFCGDEYPEPANLKKHTIEEHDDITISKFTPGKYLADFYVKLDITNLICKICNEKFNLLEQFIDHLINKHDKKYFNDIKNHIMAFKFDDNLLKCIYCSQNFHKFKNLQQHMNLHCRNYICEVCDAGFINKKILNCHSEAHKIGTFKCDLCPKVFDTHRKKTGHEKSVHVYASFTLKCGYCNEKFNSYRKKDIHMYEKHGVQIKTLKCSACEKTFESRNALTIHTKRDHLMERKHCCTECDMKFYGRRELDQHMVKHTGAKDFKCDVCHKEYGRKKTLREHMKIHNDDRRFKCEHCGQAFVQKCSWRSHMRSKHNEVV
ncbi:zinc finger protein draculin-like isoform X6 [Trichoplusia ni]|uniref:Zinc finger protein draculin-like isoform X6 n=1 Tax=Trichoplusia ni TaxID=7111 RepID=A0A7E5WUL7_TRINI|nr:zinc finger protein draculin-like isoform X6 [Trichoplusia ni]